MTTMQNKYFCTLRVLKYDIPKNISMKQNFTKLKALILYDCIFWTLYLETYTSKYYQIHSNVQIEI